MGDRTQAAERELKAHRHRLERLREIQVLLGSAGGPTTAAPDRVSITSGPGDPVAGAVALREHLTHEATELGALIRVTDTCLSLLPADQREALQRLYIYGERVASVARRFGISEPTLRRLRQRALDEVAFMLGL